jgi:multicopper oxidase
MAAAVLRAPGAPMRDATGPWKLPRRVLDVRELVDARPDGEPAPRMRVDLELGMAGQGYGWTLAGKAWPKGPVLEHARGDRVRMRFANTTAMPHPMHLHGHSFRVVTPRGDGPVKDTVLVAGMDTVSVDVLLDNPGRWAIHCHNVYHQEAGMMGEVRVR